MNLTRETQLGQVARWLTCSRILLYPEEKPDFQIMRAYLGGRATLPSPKRTQQDAPEEQANNEKSAEEGPVDEAIESDGSEDALETEIKSAQDSAALSRITSRCDMSKQEASRPIDPAKISDGTILVTWYATDDLENPQICSFWPKFNVVFQMYQYVVVVYMGSAIYLASGPQFMEVFRASQSVASLGLGLHVLGYGIGPLVLSPLSERPAIGRNPPYMISCPLFVIISQPTAFVDDVHGFMVLRFLQGLFGSPCIATTSASLGDTANLLHLSYLIMGLEIAGFIGPALGPITAGFAIVVTGCHWFMWELSWASGPSFIIFLLFLPETSTPTVLYRRADRLRNLTGNPNIKSESETVQSIPSPSQLTYDALVIPWKISTLDPAILLISMYTGLVYAVFYLFSEVCPLVFVDIYGMNLGQIGLVFLSVTIGVTMAGIFLFCFLHFYVNHRMRVKGFEGPEQWLLPAVVASFVIPVGLFIFGWCS
ncbi:MFS general substrate transporter [Setomelanomma holmii]|uniref:MFS general substrate transporter n=1 Tax=Setomelanomma holmii TaxID=210430 RepID=A0A9P4LFS8_9PLEO|nr:MFS general substrate transporter [Setomelanomma holmii]